MDVAQNIFNEIGFDNTGLFMEAFQSTTVPKSTSKQRHKIHFSQSDLTIEVDENTSLLEAAEALGIEHNSGCRIGVCKACACCKSKGQTHAEQVASDVTTSITRCNSYPRSDISLQA